MELLRKRSNGAVGGSARHTESNGEIEDQAPSEHLGAVSVAWSGGRAGRSTYAGDWLHHFCGFVQEMSGFVVLEMVEVLL